MSSERVFAIVVQYGDEGPCLECVESMSQSRGVLVTPIVVDNSPQAGRQIEQRVASVGGIYLPLPHNPGFAGGANAGIRKAQEDSSAGALVVMNADVRLHADCLQLLVRCLHRHAEVGLAGPALLSKSLPDTYWNVGSEVIWPQGSPRSFLHGSRRNPSLAEEIPPGAGCAGESLEVEDVGFVCGSVLCMRPEIPLQVGFLDESYFLYFEDADFSCRVRRAGFRTVVLPGALAWHEGGASLRGSGMLPSYYRVRGRLMFSWAWNPYPWRGRLHRFLFGLRQVVRASSRFLTRRDGDSLLPAMAVLDYLRDKRGAKGGGAEPR